MSDETRDFKKKLTYKKTKLSRIVLEFKSILDSLLSLKKSRCA